jgi:hypothetical protein
MINTVAGYVDAESELGVLFPKAHWARHNIQVARKAKAQWSADAGTAGIGANLQWTADGVEILFAETSVLGQDLDVGIMLLKFTEVHLNTILIGICDLWRAQDRRCRSVACGPDNTEAWHAFYSAANFGVYGPRAAVIGGIILAFNNILKTHARHLEVDTERFILGFEIEGGQLCNFEYDGTARIMLGLKKKMSVATTNFTTDATVPDPTENDLAQLRDLFEDGTAASTMTMPLYTDSSGGGGSQPAPW